MIATIFFEMSYSSFPSIIGKWALASLAAVNTVNASVGGGLFAILYSYILTKKFDRKLDVATLCCGILSGLVAITAICAICRPWEALLIGITGAMIGCYGK